MPGGYDFDFWQPMRPEAAREMLRGLAAPWWIAGGWAIDLHLGRESRAHEDLDIGLFADDQLIMQQHLLARGYELHAADPPGTLRPWKAGERLPQPVHDIWCRRAPDAPWEFQLMLNPGDATAWISRRDPSVSRSYAETVLDRDAIPRLAPEIQLYFKAKSLRAKDEADLQAALPTLDIDAVRWLLWGLEHTYPGHAWIETVANETRRR
jgi:hypothetical protein